MGTGPQGIPGGGRRFSVRGLLDLWQALNFMQLSKTKRPKTSGSHQGAW